MIAGYHLVRILDRREVYEPDAVREARGQPLGQRDGQPGLAHPGRAGQRQEPDVVAQQEAPGERQVPGAPHQARRLGGQRSGRAPRRRAGAEQLQPAPSAPWTRCRVVGDLAGGLAHGTAPSGGVRPAAPTGRAWSGGMAGRR